MRVIGWLDLKLFQCIISGEEGDCGENGLIPCHACPDRTTTTATDRGGVAAARIGTVPSVALTVWQLSF